MPDAICVEVKSSFASKINWTQAVGIAASVAVIFGIDLPPEQQVAIVAVIQGVQSLATWVMRTWFTSSVTQASLGQ